MENLCDGSFSNLSETFLKMSKVFTFISKVEVLMQFKNTCLEVEVLTQALCSKV